MNSPELLLLVENCPKGAETLVTRCLHSLTDKGASQDPILPSPLLSQPSPFPFPGPRTCKELLTRGHFLSGWHTIYLPDCRPLTVLCDMVTDGGGWTVSWPGSQRRPRGPWAVAGMSGRLLWWESSLERPL